MAVTRDGKGNVVPENQAYLGTEQQNAPRRPLSSRSFGSPLISSPVGNSLGAEYFSKITDGLKKIFAGAHENIELKVIEIGRENNPMLTFSCIVVAGVLRDAPQVGVAYHILIIENTGSVLQPMMKNINGQQIPVMVVASEAIEDVLLTLVKKKLDETSFLNDKVPGKSLPKLLTDGTVVGRTFNPDSIDQIFRLARNTAMALATELDANEPTFEDFNLATADIDSRLNINIGFQTAPTIDDVGHPIRSDLLISFVSTSQQAVADGALNRGNRDTNVSEVNGFIDLLWSPAPAPGIFNAYQQQYNPQLQQQTQKYAARLVITNVLSNFSYTLSSMLLSLYTTLSLQTNNNWIQYFRPQHTSDMDLRDIGALGIEANFDNNPNGIGTRIDTKSESFTLQALGKLIANLIHPGLVISMDVADMGPQSWYLSVFSAASAGNLLAVNRILTAANNLTNGNFSRHWERAVDPRIFLDSDSTILLGYYTDQKGQLRDIRDIDYLAVANLVGDRDPMAIKDWSDTFARSDLPWEMRMDARRKMINSLTGEKAIINGKATRLTFNPEFMSALSHGIMDCGLSLGIITPLSGDLFHSERASASFITAGMLNPLSSLFSIQNIGRGYQQQYQSVSPRWRG